jgi:hypothetical protein
MLALPSGRLFAFRLTCLGCHYLTPYAFDFFGYYLRVSFDDCFQISWSLRWMALVAAKLAQGSQKADHIVPA